MEVGGWVQVSLGIFLVENQPKTNTDFFGVVHHVYSVCISLLKIVGYYDLSVLSMSVMDFQKKFG